MARRFFARAADAIDTPWDIAVGNDLRHPKVEGSRPPKVRFINWYIGKLHLAARYDAKLAAAFLEVANLEAPPTRLHERLYFGHRDHNEPAGAADKRAAPGCCGSASEPSRPNARDSDLAGGRTGQQRRVDRASPDARLGRMR